MRKISLMCVVGCMLFSISACKISFQSQFDIGQTTPVDTSTITPLLSEVTAVLSGKLSTPSYTVHSNKVGSLIYGGSCSSAVSQAIVGNNTITLQALAAGTYNDCTLKLLDTDGFSSPVLELSAFTIAMPFSPTGMVPLANLPVTYKTRFKISGYDWGNMSVQFNGNVLPLVEHNPYNLVVELPDLPMGNYQLALINQYGQIDLPIEYYSTPLVSHFSAGKNHACLVRTNGTVKCWGQNASGQLGNGATLNSTKLVAVPGITHAVKVSAGEAHSCAVLANGSVQCWGLNTAKQLGDGSTTNQNTPVTVLNITGAVDVKVGSSLSCALLADESVSCWGNYQNPAVVTSGVKFLDVAAKMACAVDAIGVTQCWGENSYGLGDGTTNIHTQPVTVNGISSVKQISVGEGHSCAVTTAGALWCWGKNTHGQLANASISNSTSVPVEVAISNVDSVAVGVSHSCALKTDKKVWCWGSNARGELGDESLDQTATPVVVTKLTNVTMMDIGDQYSCAVESERLACWGNSSLILSLSTMNSAMSLVLDEIAELEQLVTGGDHYCGIKQNGDVLCWGNNNAGQLGSGKKSDVPTNSHFSNVKPIAPLSEKAKSIAAGLQHSCAVLQNGTVKCWGSNIKGQLGDGSDTSHLSPVLVDNMSQAQSIASGAAHNCVVLDSGGVSCWGANDKGQLGNNVTVTRNIPVSVMGLTNIEALNMGAEHSCALNNVGNVFCWGSNTVGQVGAGSVGVNQLQPVQIAGLNHAIMIAAGFDHTCALLQTGSIKCWGGNTKGQLGNGAQTNSLSPVDVVGLLDVQSISAGKNYSCAVMADKTVYCWGENSNSRFNDTGDQLLPVLTTVAPNARLVASGEQQTCVLMLDSYVSCWGSLADLNLRGVLYKEYVY